MVLAISVQRGTSTRTLAEFGRLVEQHGVEPAVRAGTGVQRGGAGAQRHAAVQRQHAGARQHYVRYRRMLLRAYQRLAFLQI